MYGRKQAKLDARRRKLRPSFSAWLTALILKHRDNGGKG